MNNNTKGFTLMELLIVIAVIVVLVAIAIPVFTGQLEKSKEATDLANLRTAIAEVTNAAMADELPHKSGSKNANNVYYDKHSSDKTEYYKKIVFATQTKWNWQSSNNKAKCTINGIETSASIYGWEVRCKINSEGVAEQATAVGLSQSGYEKQKAKWGQ